jgi:hypothetical protein
MAVGIVQKSLFIVGEQFESVREFLEFVFVAALIRVVHSAQFVVPLFDVAHRGGGLHT